MTTRSMQDDLTSLILPRVRALTAYRLDPHPASVKLDQNENTLGPPERILAEIEKRAFFSGLAIFRPVMFRVDTGALRVDNTSDP